MKSVAIILMFLGLAICLGAAYVFMPKDVAVSDPQFTAQISQRFALIKVYPYVMPYHQLTLSYQGETQMMVQSIGDPTEFSQPPLGHVGGCFSPSMSAIEPGTEITTRLVSAGPIDFLYQAVDNFDAPDYEDRGFQERKSANLQLP